jgi:hypothetical protein
VESLQPELAGSLLGNFVLAKAPSEPLNHDFFLSKKLLKASKKNFLEAFWGD